MPDHSAYTRACSVPGSDLPDAKPYDAGARGYLCPCGRPAASETGWCLACAPGVRCCKGLGAAVMVRLGDNYEGCPRIAGHLGERLGRPCEPPTDPAAYPKRCCGAPWGEPHAEECIFRRRTLP